MSTQLQTLMTAIMQVNAAGVAVATPHNIYNIVKRWMENMGMKNTGDYITDPVVTQQRAMLEAQIIQTTLQTLPPDVVAYYFQYGSLPIQILYALPPYVQVVFLNHTLPTNTNNTGQSAVPMQNASMPQGAGGAVTATVRPGSDSLSPDKQIGQQPADNRVPNGAPAEPTNGVGGY